MQCKQKWLPLVTHGKKSFILQRKPLASEAVGAGSIPAGITSWKIAIKALK